MRGAPHGKPEAATDKLAGPKPHPNCLSWRATNQAQQRPPPNPVCPSPSQAAGQSHTFQPTRRAPQRPFTVQHPKWHHAALPNRRIRQNSNTLSNYKSHPPSQLVSQPTAVPTLQGQRQGQGQGRGISISACHTCWFPTTHCTVRFASQRICVCVCVFALQCVSVAGDWKAPLAFRQQLNQMLSQI